MKKITKRLYYFHGWNSAIPKKLHRSSKMRAMLSFCRKNKYQFRPTDVDFQVVDHTIRTVIRDIEEAIEYENITEFVLVGTSLGGWLARIIQLNAAHLVDDEVTIQTIALNPAIEPAEGLLIHTGKMHTNYESGETKPWNRFDCEQLAETQAGVVMSAPYPFYVFVDKGDELIPWEESKEYYGKMSYFTAYDEGSHRFEHLAEALNEYESRKINAFWA